MLRIVAFLSVLIASPAFAQTVTKAPATVPSFGYPATSGFYFGVNAEAAASGVTSAPAGTVQTGGDIGLTVGYATPLAGIPLFAEFIGDFQNLNAGNAGFSMSGPLHLEQRVGAQIPLLQFLPMLGLGNPLTPTSPVLPPGVTPNGPAQTYVFGGVNEDDISAQLGVGTARAWMISAEVGPGLLTPIKLSNGWNAVIDTWIAYTAQSSALCIGGICPKMGNGVRGGVSVKF